MERVFVFILSFLITVTANDLPYLLLPIVLLLL